MLRNNNQAVIKYLTSDMSTKMQNFAIDCGSLAILRYHYAKGFGDMAEYVKDEFEQKYGKYWCCFVFDGNTGFGSYFTKANNYYIHFVIRNVNFVVFKQVG